MEHVNIVQTKIHAHVNANRATKENSALSKLTNANQVPAKMAPNASIMSTIFTVIVQQSQGNSGVSYVTKKWLVYKNHAETNLYLATTNQAMFRGLVVCVNQDIWVTDVK